MPQMFLRTALTEQRIETLEKQMERVLKHLKLPLDEAEEQEAPPFEPDPPKSLSKVAERIAKGKKAV